VIDFEPGARRFIVKPPPRTTDSNRQKRRELIKALGKRQFKKLYRKAP